MTGDPEALRPRVRRLLRELQDRICADLETVDGVARFREDRWTYSPGDGPGDGGGLTRVIEGGAVFEKGGVNVSEVAGSLSQRLAQRLKAERQNFFATGISLVLHPDNPHVPTVHANLRYLELRPTGAAPEDPPARAWFGGGTDLTPYYLYEEDAVHFHRTLRVACETASPGSYPGYKAQCDDYFRLPHRDEARGVGGIFFDYLEDDLERDFGLVTAVGDAFTEAYLPIVRRRVDTNWSRAQKDWQRVRRGRYVEFNLIHDRGTLFGLETRGRTESILMSLPPDVSWAYDHHPEPGSPEAALVDRLRNPRDWV